MSTIKQMLIVQYSRIQLFVNKGNSIKLQQQNLQYQMGSGSTMIQLNGQISNKTSKVITYTVTSDRLTFTKSQTKSTTQTNLGAKADIKKAASTSANYGNKQQIKMNFKSQQVETIVILKPGQPPTTTGLKRVMYIKPTMCGVPSFSYLNVWVGTKESIIQILFENAPIKCFEDLNLQFYQRQNKEVYFTSLHQQIPPLC